MEQKIGYIATKNFKQDKLIFEVGKTYEITRQFGYAASYVGMYYYKNLEELISDCDIDINDFNGRDDETGFDQREIADP